MVERGQQDARVVAITAAMTSGTGLTEFARQYPERFLTSESVNNMRLLWPQVWPGGPEAGCGYLFYLPAESL